MDASTSTPSLKEDVEVKKCSRCSIKKETYNFGQRNGKPVSWCRSCQAEYARSYYVRNKDRARMYMRRYYEKNRSTVLEKSKQYYFKHRDARLNYARERGKTASQTSHTN